MQLADRMKSIGVMPILGAIALLLVVIAVAVSFSGILGSVRQTTLSTANPNVQFAPLTENSTLPELVAALGRSETAAVEQASDLLRIRIIRWRSLDQQQANDNRETLAELLAEESPSWPHFSRHRAVDLCVLMMESSLEMASDRRSVWLQDCETVMKSAAARPAEKSTENEPRESLPSEFFTPPAMPRSPS